MTAAVLTLGDITPEWLSPLLGKQVSAVNAVSIGTGQVGATYRLTLTYADGCDKGPASIVAKLPSLDPVSRAAGTAHLTYLRESRFYQHFAGKKPMSVPECLYVAFDDNSHDFTLIMRDLPQHCAGNQLVAQRKEEARSAVAAAATIHAAWWNEPSLEQHEWLGGMGADFDAHFSLLWPAFRERYQHRLTADVARVGDYFVGKIKRWLELRQGPKCLVHNDFRPDNMLYPPDPSATPIIVDWQTVGIGCGASDIAYYAGTALDPDDRRAWEDGLLGHYHDHLTKSGVVDIDIQQIIANYRASAFAGFFMGATAAMVVQQTSRGDEMFLAMCNRSAAMVIDHWQAATVD